MAKRDSFWSVMKSAFRNFSEDDCSSMAGALAYFTIFSLPPLLLILIAIIGFVFGEQAAQGQIIGQIRGYVGEEGASAIQTMIAQAGKSQTGGIVATVVGVVGLLLGAIGAFMQLQKALNKTWEVEPDPDRGGIMTFLTKRLLSFGMLLVIVFLLIASVVAGTIISAAGGVAQEKISPVFTEPFLQILNFLTSFLIIIILFALMFKYLPDARARWRDIWMGAAITALLFGIGKLALGIYLGKSNPGSAYGAAGSLIVLLLWIYYASLILLFGAEFTQAWAKSRGSEISPDEGAVKIIREKKKSRS